MEPEPLTTSGDIAAESATRTDAGLKALIGTQIESGRKESRRGAALGPDPNCALIWFPPIEHAGLPVPRTEFIEFNPDSLLPVLDGLPMGEFPMDKLEEAGARVGYP
jgi:hypothetical protein